MCFERSTIRWERDDDGIVILTLDDPSQSANTMNSAYAESMRAIVARLEQEKDQIKGVIITSAKKTFFAGGDLNALRLVSKENAQRVRRRSCVRSRRSCARSRRSACRSSRRSTAPRSAAAWRSRWPLTTASSSMTRRLSSASPRSTSGCCRAPAASPARVRMVGIARRADGRPAAGHEALQAGRGQGARAGR